MQGKISRLAAVFLIGVLVLTGCGQAVGRTAENAVQKENKVGLNIVTSFYPVYIAAINVTRDVPGVSVQNMTKPQTGCLHDYSLTPEDLKLIETADVFVINGAGMEAFLDNVIKQQENLKIIEASKDIQLLKDSSGEENAHVWVSVTNAITYVYNIATQLASIDADNAEQYMANAASYAKKLEELKNDMHASIDKLTNKNIITFHEAFPYFAQEFDLNIVAVIEREPGTEPTPKELAGIIDTVGRSGIKALFAEPQYSSKSADVIARETGAKVYTLDPVVTGEAGPDAYDDYITKMEQNKKVLLEALGVR